MNEGSTKKTTGVTKLH